MRRRTIQRSMIPLGKVDPMPATLSRKRRLEARLAAAWSRVAGMPLADRLRARGIRRGILEIEPRDSRWEGIAEAVAAALATRVARSEPGLGIRGFRIVRPGGERSHPGPFRPLDESAAAHLPETKAPASRRGLEGSSGNIREIARRYLERTSGGRSGPR